MLTQSCKHHHAVKPQVRGLIDDITAITADGGILGSDDGFDRFFTDLFQNLVQTLVVQAGDIRTVGSGALACFKHFGQTGQGVSHVCVLPDR